MPVNVFVDLCIQGAEALHPEILSFTDLDMLHKRLDLAVALCGRPLFPLSSSLRSTHC